MAELLVRVVDKTNPDDPYLDAQLTKRGDVICVQPDDWLWGVEELENPDWRIIKLPGIGVDELASLLAPEIDADPLKPSRMLQRRAYRLDLDHVALTGARAVLDDPDRKEPAKALAMPLATLLAARVRKPKRQDPNIFELDDKPSLEL